ncbi:MULTISPECIES: FkbM family methyltransferase [unclassified Ruegeria]|uniref:FkbM family methyltransferase n=1 Tax=unclassified Ruegeria TaxID=2625375 RepID=UPI001ADB5847|nr:MULTISPECIES: FkbM family methyltransferase [unclassified Ruegeria]MBO9410317.1 FkbM family methyltransferase [Ruegeria sp. R8_1]MBO9414464.1 FkbM family methyltransferase [Ruegeria sp. R8_2]
MLTQARKMFYRARGYYSGSLNGERFRLDPYHSKFWRKASAGLWEPETFAVLDAHLKPESDYLDIGAWIGPTVLYGARRARHVWCFEPDPTAYRYLAWNMDLNNVRNVSAFGVALSDRFGVARMASVRGEPGDSTSSLLHDAAHGSDALTIAWDQFEAATDLSSVSLVKMDIEGAEYMVLPSLVPFLKVTRPALYLSTHAPLLPEAQRQDRMAKLADLLSFYPSCRTANGEEVEVQALTAPTSLNGFQSFVFSG